MAEEDFYDQERGEAELEDKDIDEGDEWKVIEAYFTSSSQVLVQQQLDSFDAFCSSSINDIIKDTEVVSVKVDPNNPADRRTRSLYFGKKADSSDDDDMDVRFYPPFNPDEKDPITNKPLPLTPNECRLRNMTYSSKMCMRIYSEVKGDDSTEPEAFVKRVDLGMMPVMLRSYICNLRRSKDVVEMGECPFDCGGYFIVNGSEKVLIAQEKMAANRVSVFRQPPGSKYSYTAEVRSCDVQAYRPPRTLTLRLFSSATRGTSSNARIARKGQSNCIQVRLPYVNSDIPMVVLFRAMGYEEDKDILLLLSVTNLM